MIPVLFSESSPRLSSSASAGDLARITVAAELAGWRVVHVSQDLMTVNGVEDALAHVARPDQPTPAIWCGYIPRPADYAAVYHALEERGYRLLNTPNQYRDAEEFDRFYPSIQDLTPRSVCVSDVSECDTLPADLPYPMFIKGTVQSLKSEGLASCLVHDREALRDGVARLLRLDRRSLGRVIIREYVPLRHEIILSGGFPAGREYRVFLYRRQIIGFGYYWDHTDPLAVLSADEQSTVLNLAQLAAERIRVPYIAVDIGQATSGEWFIIEVGDGQFSGVSQVPIQALWHRLTTIVTDSTNTIGTTDER